MPDEKMCCGLMPGYELLFERGNVVSIYNINAQSVELKIGLKSPEAVRVFKMFDGTKTLAECLEGTSDETADSVRNVIDKYIGRVFCMKSQKEADHASRHAKNFLLNNSESFKFHPFQMRGILRDDIAASRIVLFGCGLLGMEIYEQLRTIGVSDFVFIDSGRVTSDDVHYSGWYSETDISSPRIDVIKEKLRGDSSVNTEFFGSMEEAGDISADDKKVLAVVCEEGITRERLISFNRMFIERNIRWVSVYVDSEKISVGPYIIPGVTSCIECFGEQGKYEFPLYYGFNCTEMTAERLAASVFANEFYYIAGDVCECLIKDVSLSLCRQFIIKKRDLEAYRNEIAIDCSCICHSKESGK